MFNLFYIMVYMYALSTIIRDEFASGMMRFLKK